MPGFCFLTTDNWQFEFKGLAEMRGLLLFWPLTTESHIILFFPQWHIYTFLYPKLPCLLQSGASH